MQLARSGRLHVTGVTEVHAASVGALVGTVLQVDDALTGAQLILGEVALVLIGRLGSKERSGPFGVQVAGAAKSHDALSDLGDVSPLVQVDSLKDINVGHAVVSDGGLEFVDILHHLELTAGGVDLGNGAWLQLVHQSAQDGTIAEHLLEGARLQTLAEHGLDPAEHLSLKLGITLASDLVGNLGAKAITATTGGHF